MSPPLKKVVNRLSRTSWDELRMRFSQELTKRADYAFYRAGRLAEPELTSDSSHESKFFFQPDELAGRVALIKQHLPSALNNMIEEASEILQHRFRLLGYRNLDYGPKIDWHLDAVHGKRAPLKPWYKIRFLDFDEVGDHKIIWELNRHQHLVTLAKAWAFAGNEQYVTEIQKQFYSWKAANPYPVGINWGSSLEVAFRSLSWLWVRNLLKGASALSNSFDLDLLRSLARNGRYIETFLSTYFSPNTHLIGEAIALFFIGTLCPEIPSSRRWQEKGFAIVLAETERQVRPDGVYFEQSLYYHVYALDFFLHTRALAAANGISVPGWFDLVLRKMLNFVQVLSNNGPPQSFGDDDGGRVFHPRRNRLEHMSDPLALGAALFQEETLCDSAAVTEEAIWLFGDKAIGRAGAANATPARSTAFPDGGLYLMATDEAQILIDAGPHGAGSGGHGHADALSVRLSMNGKHWLVDPGSYVYVAPASEREARDQFRGTAAHNTLLVDGVDQALPRSPFSWTSLPEVSTEDWISAPQFDFFSGSHRGYTRLPDPVVHRRMIFHLRGEYWLVRDIAEGKSVHDLAISWHFTPDLQVSISGEALRAVDSTGDSLVLLGTAADAWELTSEDGYVSPAYGERQRAPVGVFKKRAQLPAEHATLLLATRSARTAGELRLVSTERCAAYTYGSEDILVFGKPDTDWTFQAFRSDAKFLFARCGANEIDLLFVMGASFIEWNGQSVFRSEKPCAWLQWHKADGATASDPELLKFFAPEVLRAGTAVTLKQ